MGLICLFALNKNEPYLSQALNQASISVMDLDL